MKKSLRELIGSKLIDVEQNVNGFTVLYFKNEKGEVYSVELGNKIRKLSN